MRGDYGGEVMSKRREVEDQEIINTIKYLNRLESWYFNNHKRIMKEYANKWIVINQFKIIDANKNRNHIIKKYGGKSKFLIKYVSKKHTPMLL